MWNLTQSNLEWLQSSAQRALRSARGGGGQNERSPLNLKAAHLRQQQRKADLAAQHAESGARTAAFGDWGALRSDSDSDSSGGSNGDYGGRGRDGGGVLGYRSIPGVPVRTSAELLGAGWRGAGPAPSGCHAKILAALLAALLLATLGTLLRAWVPQPISRATTRASAGSSGAPSAAAFASNGASGALRLTTIRNLSSSNSGFKPWHGVTNATVVSAVSSPARGRRLRLTHSQHQLRFREKHNLGLP